MDARDVHGASRHAERDMVRRNFLALAVAFVGFGRRVWSQATTVAEKYARLVAPVRVPLEGLTTPWNPVTFAAAANLPAPTGASGQQIRIDGVLLRTASGDDHPDRFRAFCLICPHESCAVKFVSDVNMAADLSGGAASGPVFSCGCHRSLFDGKEGAKLTGPVHRGLYRFRIDEISNGTVVIGAIEEDLFSG
jgi:Rieske Fe-S protein